MATDDPGAGDLLGHRLSLAVVLFHQALADALGVGVTEHKVLDMLAHDGPLTPGALARRSGLSNAAVTKVVDRLRDAGYVSRMPSTRDGRSVEVVLTDAYRAAAGRPAAGVAARVARLNEGFTREELAVVQQWLVGAIDALEVETARLRSAPAG